MIWFVKKVDGICEQCITLESPEDAGEQPPTEDGEIHISAPVGIHGTNFSSDVRKIQDALNHVPTDKGGASPELKLDSKCGQKTENAIQNFQLKHFGWKSADGLIEPGKQTLAKLNEILGKTRQSVGSQDIVAPFVIQLALSFITAAKYNMLSAYPVLNSKDFSSRESLMYLLNKHFSLDSFQDRREAFNKIKNKYDYMIQVFQNLGGIFGTATFERDPTANLRTIAYAHGGGYFMLGQIMYKKYKKIRKDRIYLCTRFLNMNDQNEQAFTVVHELAHFVARFEEIRDYAYNREGATRGAKVRSLPPQLKILNAECFANFAYEARTRQEPWHL